MIWSDKANAYVMTVEEAFAKHPDMCWDGSDWSAEDIKEADEWFARTQKILNG